VSASAWHYLVYTRATVASTTTNTIYVDGVAHVLTTSVANPDLSINSNFGRGRGDRH